MSNILIFVILSANHASEETTLVMVCFTKNRKIANFEYLNKAFTRTRFVVFQLFQREIK